MKAVYGDTSKPLQVCQSAGGFYIGRLCEDGAPYARDSVEYFPTEEAAHNAFVTGRWTLRTAP